MRFYSHKAKSHKGRLLTNKIKASQTYKEERPRFISIKAINLFIIKVEIPHLIGTMDLNLITSAMPVKWQVPLIINFQIITV